MDTATASPMKPGALLVAVTASHIARPLYVALAVTMLLAFMVMLASSVKTLDDALVALVLLAGVLSLPAIFIVQRWIAPQIVAVHEHGVRVRRRGVRRFVPWSDVTNIVRETVFVQGVMMRVYVVACGDATPRLGEAFFGVDFTNRLIDEITTRARLRWTPDGERADRVA